ncbi:MAG: HlyD family secretion protein [Alphaproteobacteria bacterium]|nr:HlyD family secretion protein [Alphaproteobacteria bacterium]MBU0798968.1 HlyD family secretion protein [Alphaproteobacteria bacterium]MBU0887223.1 HlyD family secretion protein [Alphaproteobacteria bacterium]MBU1812249.1 HlyD family secretion protein [Alphaproteobacteria bacterium]MBU2088951.1 HlyD family secretion protein [Alphaproteobacteria bacterium]
MRKIALALVGLGLLSAGLYAAWMWHQEWRYIQSTDNAYVQADISVISPKVAGYVDAVAVQDNQYVRAGDLLVTLDARDYAARVSQAAATVAVERSAIAGFDSQTVLQRSRIVQAAAAIDSAQAEAVRARRDHARLSALRRDDVVSRQRLEGTEADLAKANAALASARAALQAEQQQLAVLETSRKSAEARVAQAIASQAMAEIDLENTAIRAPVDGVIGNRGVQIGHYVRAGTHLLSVVPLPHVHVLANFKETQIGRMRPGQTARIEIDAYPDTVLTGVIASIAPASGSEFSLLPPENATGNFTKIVQRLPVRIDLPADNPLKELLRPGMSAVVSVDIRDTGRP